MSVGKLRSMQEADIEMVLQWRNHPNISRYMYTTKEISLSEHRLWFAGVSADSNVDVLIFERDGIPEGFVNIARTRSRKIADWGFYLAPKATKGSGSLMAEEVLAYAFDTLHLHKICGQAISFNERSIRFHLKVGFTEEGRLREQHFDGSQYHDVICFGLLKSEWQALNGGENEHA